MSRGTAVFGGFCTGAAAHETCAESGEAHRRVQFAYIQSCSADTRVHRVHSPVWLPGVSPPLTYTARTLRTTSAWPFFARTFAYIGMPQKLRVHSRTFAYLQFPSIYTNHETSYCLQEAGDFWVKKYMHTLQDTSLFQQSPQRTDIHIYIYICIYIYMIKALTAAAETASIERQCYKPRILSVFGCCFLVAAVWSRRLLCSSLLRAQCFPISTRSEPSRAIAVQLQ